MRRTPEELPDSEPTSLFRFKGRKPELGSTTNGLKR